MFRPPMNQEANVSQFVDLGGESDAEAASSAVLERPDPLSKKRPREHAADSLQMELLLDTSDGEPSSNQKQHCRSEPESEATAKTGAPEQSWDTVFEDLREYHRTKGHCLISATENPVLVQWMTRQRNQYGLLPAHSKASALELKRAKALDDIDFVWHPETPKWEGRFRELAEFRHVHGHCCVPRRYPDNPQLGDWVAKQRAAYKQVKSGKPSSITPSRVQRLEGLDFLRELPPQSSNWEDRFNKLVEYQVVHGHCRVPSTFVDNPQLGTWVTNQRSHFKKLAQGKPSPLTPSRIRRLDGLGFTWSIRGKCGVSKSNETWETRLQQLSDFRCMHGHCRVPNTYAASPSLGLWATKQRTLHRNVKAGKHSALSPRRLKDLDELGFDWNSKGSRRRVLKKTP